MIESVMSGRPVAGEPSDANSERSLEILRRVRPVLARQGFDGASMQQLARAAGMSAGNFYRYFPSKDAIIAALVERDLQELEDDFSRVRASPDPRRAFGELLGRRLTESACEMAPLMIETEAAAMRRPEIARLLHAMDAAIERNLVDLFRALGAPADQDQTVLRAHARLIMLLVKGVMRSACPSDAGGQASGYSAELARLAGETIESTMRAVLGRAPAAVGRKGARS